MTGTPVAHLMVDALKNEYPRALHITELANLTGVSITSVSSSLNNRLGGGVHGDVERVSRGVWKYVPPAKPKAAKSLRPASADRVPEAWSPKGRTPEEEATNQYLPKTLKVVGTTSQGLLAVDTNTNQSYVATKM
jgi:hypothetical protein